MPKRKRTCGKKGCACTHREVARNVVFYTKRAARAFRLSRFKGIRINESLKEYGKCWPDGNIEIRLTSAHYNWKMLSREELADTVAHELAHLQVWKHGKAHTLVKNAIFVYLLRQ